MKKTNKSKSLIVALSIASALTLATGVTSGLAWFTTNLKVTAAMKITAKATNPYLQISNDGSSWTTAIAAGEKAAVLDFVHPMNVGTGDGYYTVAEEDRTVPVGTLVTRHGASGSYTYTTDIKVENSDKTTSTQTVEIPSTNVDETRLAVKTESTVKVEVKTESTVKVEVKTLVENVTAAKTSAEVLWGEAVSNDPNAAMGGVTHLDYATTGTTAKVGDRLYFAYQSLKFRSAGNFAAQELKLSSINITSSGVTTDEAGNLSGGINDFLEAVHVLIMSENGDVTTNWAMADHSGTVTYGDSANNYLAATVPTETPGSGPLAYTMFVYLDGDDEIAKNDAFKDQLAALTVEAEFSVKDTAAIANSGAND